MEKQRDTRRVAQPSELRNDTRNTASTRITDQHSALFDAIAEQEATGKSIYSGSLYDAANPAPEDADVAATAEAQIVGMKREMYRDLRIEIRKSFDSIIEELKKSPQDQESGSSIVLQGNAKATLSEEEIDELVDSLIAEGMEE